MKPRTRPKRAVARILPFARTAAIACVLGVFALLANMGAARAQVPDDPTETCPVLAGETAPDAEVVTIDGNTTTLHEVIGDSPTIVIFYRGVW